ncbi:type II toxin-antitoxin system ParD family antitoxin [Pseudomonas sp.]|uniref:ribbon-helix-helix domain-containing protein n=1 Tax=Pseudomonas sp. TaxID=306 RepID=UPI00258B5452|nr:type II toxin-antitoxin system ParD family antitoxin [Pseudomonas sp.]
MLAEAERSAFCCQRCDYTNDSEYIRDLLRREQERSAEVEAIRAALMEGESSGEPRSFDADAFKQRMLTAHG